MDTWLAGADLSRVCLFGVGGFVIRESIGGQETRSPNERPVAVRNSDTRLPALLAARRRIKEERIKKCSSSFRVMLDLSIAETRARIRN